MSQLSPTERLARLAVLERAMTFYGQTPEDYDEDVEEDVRPYFDGSQEPQKWCCVTSHDDKVFFLPAFDNRGAAASRAVEFVNDDIFAEIPVEIIDLDTGTRIVPRWQALDWAEGVRSYAP